MSPRADSIFRSRQRDGRNVDTSYLLTALDSDQTTNLTAPNHVQFQNVRQSSADMAGALSVGTAQQQGIVTLPAGKIFECEAGFSFEAGAGSDQLCCSIYDLLEDAAKGVGGFAKTLSNVENRNDSPIAKAFIDTRERSGIVTIEFRILSGAGVSRFNSGGGATEGDTWLKVRAI